MAPLPIKSWGITSTIYTTKCNSPVCNKPHAEPRLPGESHVFIYLLLCVALHKVDARTHRLLEAKNKKSNTCYGKQSRLLCIHCLCLWEWDLPSGTLETQEQNHSVNRAFGGGTLFHIMIRYHQWMTNHHFWHRGCINCLRTTSSITTAGRS